MAFLDLPNELTIQILSHLTNQDLIACQLLNSALYSIIKTSVMLQFQIALSTFKATDNPSSPLSVSERLQALKDSEDAWTFLRNDFKQTIPVNFEVSGIYDLTGGVFLLGNASRKALHYVKLPSSIEDDVGWKKVQLNEEGTIVDMGFCLHEHDLLAVVTTKPCHVLHSRTTYDIKIVLFKLSTREPHPAAKESTIFIVNSNWDRFGVGIEIVGDRLVLILTYRFNQWMPDDLVFVYDWRNAVQTMSFVAPSGSYSGLVFLSENLIVIPNARTNALEIWDILSTHQTPRPACILQLPELSPGNSLFSITCRGEPNPIGSRSQIQSDKPFYRSAHEAIMLFHIHIQLGDLAAHQLQHGGNMSHTYTVFVHRKALCEIYERQCVGTNSKSEDSFGGMPDVQVEGSSRLEDSGLEDKDAGLGEMFVMLGDEDEDEDEDEGYDDDDDESESVEGSENEDYVFKGAADDNPIPIPWSSWGPPITRWIPADNSNATLWITTTAGQRGVICRSHPEMAGQYIVLDFNPENLRRAETLSLDASTRIQCFRNWEVIQADGLFKEPVVGKLPFAICTTESSYAWDGTLIDEERVLGLEAVDGRISAIEIHHFGGAQN